MEKTNLKVTYFSHISFDHIYRHTNEEVDKLSKNGLDLDKVTCMVIKDKKGHKT